MQLQHITQVLAVFRVGRCLMPNVITWSTGVSWLLSYVQHTRHYELLVKFVIWWPSYLGESQAWNFHHKSKKWETLLTWSQGSDGIPTIQPGAQQWHFVWIVIITSTVMQCINPSQYVMLNTQCLVNPDTDTDRLNIAFNKCPDTQFSLAKIKKMLLIISVQCIVY